MSKLYKDIYKTELRVGVFTVLIIIGLILSYAWMRNAISSRSYYQINIVFNDINGLEIGDEVLYKGMSVGRIKKIWLSGNDIIVRCLVDKEIKLHEGSAFFIQDKSLMGGKELVINQGTSDKLIDTNRLQYGSSSNGIQAILTSANSAIGEIRALLAELQREKGILHKSDELIDNSNQTVLNINQSVEQLRSDVHHTILNIDKITSTVHNLVQSNQVSINNTVSETPVVLKNLGTTLDSLQIVSHNLILTLQKVNQGKGTAARLINEDDIYNKLSQSITDLNELISDIKKNPKKYVKLSIF